MPQKIEEKWLWWIIQKQKTQKFSDLAKALLNFFFVRKNGSSHFYSIVFSIENLYQMFTLQNAC